MHHMDANTAILLPTVIERGDYYQSPNRGTDLQIEVVLHQPDALKRAYFLVLSRNRLDSAVYIRTFFFNAKLSRRKMEGATKLLIQSTHNYFK